jgi:hypothetical protein
MDCGAVAVARAPEWPWLADVGRAWCVLLLLIFLGLCLFTAVGQLTKEAPRQCGPFALGVSKIGGCDYLM